MDLAAKIFWSTFGIAMCKPKDKSGQIAREAEEKRQREIAAGRSEVNDVFGRYDDSFFKQREDEYASHYMPQVEDQFRTAHESSVKRLAGRGALDSSAGARILGELAARHKGARSDVASQAYSHGQQTRNNILGARNDVLAQVESGLSPTSARSMAQTEAGRHSAASEYSPLGDLFATALNQFGTAAILQQEGFHGTGIPGLNPKREKSMRVVS